MNMTREQADKLRLVLQPHVGFIVTLRERMQRAGMDLDPLFKDLLKAEHALRDFAVMAHYRSCASGAGRNSNDDDQPTTNG
ncbi:MAG TPA: hypothetical protein VHR66_32955 [Gemmataceae bacterium]|jgi:hypothetical protein|nr:hypothetical protein [Gemmataceae bacterium]